MIKNVKSPKKIEITITPPGDKSISHRAALLNSFAYGTAHVSNFCVGDDRTSMLGCLKGLGATIIEHSGCTICNTEECFEIRGNGFEGLTEPSNVLWAGNSGTTMRLISGLLAGLDFYTVINGDESLRKRPMRRITAPLETMGASISGRDGGALAPLAFNGGNLEGIKYEMPVASAQLKSCLLIAGLLAKGGTTVIQPAESRDHTERMLQSMGAHLETNGLSITIKKSHLNSVNVKVPCDTSSSAFWLVAGCCHPNAKINLQNVGMNPTRTGVLEVLKEMGADILIKNERIEGGEPVADLVASSSKLEAVEISGDIIPRVVDELPVLSLAACFAKGTTLIKDAQELRVKESDRISSTVDILAKLGADIEETDDGMKIKGGRQLEGTTVSSHGDHRIAMTSAIAGLVSTQETIINGAEAASVSYPTFWDSINSMQD